MTQYLDYTGLQQYTNIIKQKLNELSGRGRYLSNWNCKTGLPTTEPENLPYVLKNGDYFIVSETYANPGPSRIEIEKYGSVEYELDDTTFVEKLDPADGDTNIFSYSDLRIEKPDNRGTEQLIVIDYDKFYSTYPTMLSSAQTYANQHQFGTITEVLNRQISYFYAGSMWYFHVNLLCNTDSQNDIVLPCDDFKMDDFRATCTEAQWKQKVIDHLQNTFGMTNLGDLYIGDDDHKQNFVITNGNTESWLLNNQELASGDTIASYGFTITSDPATNDMITTKYISEKWNYRPVAEIVLIDDVPTPCYNGHASSVIETELVNPNDSYLFDGSVWILLKNTVTIDSELSLTSENAVQNKVITEELNKKSGVIFRVFEDEEESE